MKLAAARDKTASLADPNPAVILSEARSAQSKDLRLPHLDRFSSGVCAS
jgi:hypothetical protein